MLDVVIKMLFHCNDSPHKQNSISDFQIFIRSPVVNFIFRWQKLDGRSRRMFPTTETLSITNVEKEDEGTYACIAANAAGEMVERIQVLVRDDGTSVGQPGPSYPDQYPPSWGGGGS